jgi:hypothetical protein
MYQTVLVPASGLSGVSNTEQLDESFKHHINLATGRGGQNPANITEEEH